MIKHTYLAGRGRQKCDLCQSIKVPDSRITFIDENGEEYGSLLLCFSCSEKLINELNLSVDKRLSDKIYF